MSSTSTFCGVLLALGLTACASTPPPEPLQPEDIPLAWSEPVPAADVWPASDWWRALGSPELGALVVAAKENNLDLAGAAARVLQAEAQMQISGAALFPTVGIGAAAQRQGAGENGSTVGNTLFGLVAEASYELDFWGLARSNVRAAEALLKSAKFAQETVALTVTAGTAAGYLDILALRQRIAIARDNLASAERVLDAIEKRAAGGLSSPLDLAQQQALVAGLAAEIPALEQQERESRFNLALLLGRAPEGFTVRAENLDALEMPAVAPGLPSELLQRRPDVAGAQANLNAANANIAAARAAFFPAITLTGTGGAASGAISTVTDGIISGGVSAAAGGTGLIYGIGVSVLQTIFDGGRREGQVALARAKQEELVADYRSTVFRAFSDVETALSQTQSLTEQERLKAAQAVRAAAAFDISQVQYREGLIDLLALLQAQQTLFTVQDQLAQIRLARFRAAIGLYKALGGGWTNDVGTGVLAATENRSK